MRYKELKVNPLITSEKYVYINLNLRKVRTFNTLVIFSNETTIHTPFVDIIFFCLIEFSATAAKFVNQSEIGPFCCKFALCTNLWLFQFFC